MGGGGGNWIQGGVDLGVVLEGGARGETIVEASMVITEVMPGQLTAVAFAAGECGQARRTRMLRRRRGTVASVTVRLQFVYGRRQRGELNTVPSLVYNTRAPLCSKG